MSHETRDVIFASTRRALAPLIRLMLRSGISAGEFKTLVDRVYVEQARLRLVSAGQRATYSRIAVSTGLQRHLVSGLLDASPDDFTPRSSTQLQRATRALEGWHEDPDFLDHSGAPRPLALRDHALGFPALVERYCGGVTTSTVLKELSDHGAIQEANSRVIPLRRSLDAGGLDPSLLHDLGRTGEDLFSTFLTNVSAEDARETLPIRAVRGVISAPSLKLFRSYFRKQANLFLESMESFISQHPPKSDTCEERKGGGEALEVAATVFAAAAHPIIRAEVGTTSANDLEAGGPSITPSRSP